MSERVHLADGAITVEEDTLREAGWRPDAEGPEMAVEVVTKWHNEVHPGAFRFCDERPCADLRDAEREW